MTARLDLQLETEPYPSAESQDGDADADNFVDFADLDAPAPESQGVSAALRTPMTSPDLAKMPLPDYFTDAEKTSLRGLMAKGDREAQRLQFAARLFSGSNSTPEQKAGARKVLVAAARGDSLGDAATDARKAAAVMRSQREVLKKAVRELTKRGMLLDILEKRIALKGLDPERKTAYKGLQEFASKTDRAYELKKFIEAEPLLTADEALRFLFDIRAYEEAPQDDGIHIEEENPETGPQIPSGEIFIGEFRPKDSPRGTAFSRIMGRASLADEDYVVVAAEERGQQYSSRPRPTLDHAVEDVRKALASAGLIYLAPSSPVPEI